MQTTDDGAQPVLAVRNVSHWFGKRQALDQVSFEVDRGRFVALLGENGAGKSTLFAIITRLFDPALGSVWVAGTELKKQPRQALAKMGVVFQSRALDPGLTLMENLSYHSALHGIPGRRAREKARFWLHKVGLNDRRDERVDVLSGGQVRRAEIARALQHNPSLLLLDEATAGLDVKSRLRTIEIVRSLTENQQIGVLWSTHLVDEIQGSDRLIVLHLGRILADDQAASISGEQPLDQAFLSMIKPFEQRRSSETPSDRMRTSNQ